MNGRVWQRWDCVSSLKTTLLVVEAEIREYGIVDGRSSNGNKAGETTLTGTTRLALKTLG